MIEIGIPEILEEYLKTHYLQFGADFRHFTDMCIFTVKRLMKCYQEHSSLHTFTGGKYNILPELTIVHYLLS